MKYMGSKNRIAKYIVPILEKAYFENECEIFIDACCGGCNLIDKINPNIPRYANDYNEYLIEMYKAVCSGWLPNNNYTEEHYKYIRENKEHNKILTAYFGFALSYGGKWFGGWCRDKDKKRNYVLEAYNNALKQFPKLKDIVFSNKSIIEIKPTKKALIYCDIPYRNTTKYKNEFPYDYFYKWCKEMKEQGHNVFISEYEMPSEFIEVWSSNPITSSLTKETGSKKAIEKLFTL